jgi:predicted DNA-binding transcriptional regulator AlpA
MTRKIVHTEESVLLDVHGLATMLNRSERTIHRLNDSGKIPKPLRINRGLLWRKSDILLWLDHDCCSRRQFEKIRKAVNINGK